MVLRIVYLVLCANFIAFSDARSIKLVSSARTSTVDRLQVSSSVDSVPPKSVYMPKFTMVQLLDHVYETKISNDIDLDPCKTGKFPL